MPDLWKTRRDAEQALSGTLQNESSIVDTGFRIVDIYTKGLSGIDSSFAGVCCCVLAKGRNLSLACYSLALDGLAQEGGAVLRPLIETIELLFYFAQDTSRAEDVIQGRRLPKAGKIASTIDSAFRSVRDYLNDHASHVSFSYPSMRHIIDVENGVLRNTQRHSDAVLIENLKVIWAALFMLAIGAARCLDASKALTDDMIDLLEEWRRLAISVFGFALEDMADLKTQDSSNE